VDQKISAPADEDFTSLARQVLRASKLVELHLHQELPGDERDLELLQALLDARVLKPTDTADLQCLGIVLGMRLSDAIDGLDWAMVEDEYGRDPALRYFTSSILIFPLTMISKRIEDGMVVDVRLLILQTRESIDRLKAQVSWGN
jgi:hypothetical protein